MNTQQRSLIIITLLIISTFISGCDVIFGGGGPAATEAAKLQADLLARATQTAIAAAQLTAAAKPTLTFTPVPSNTPTNTPPPTLTPTPAPTATFTPIPAPKEVTGGMNQRLVLGNIALTVMAAKLDSGNLYVPVNIENHGKEPFVYNFSNFTLIDSNQTIAADPNIPYAKTGPGTIASGQAASPVVTFKSSRFTAKPLLIFRSVFGGVITVVLIVQ